MANKGDFDSLLKQYKVLEMTYEPFLMMFAAKMGEKVLRKTKKRTPASKGKTSGWLRSQWAVQKPIKSGDTIYVSILNEVEYASFVEDGHRQEARFVPGEWVGDTFVYKKYVPGEKGVGGMMLTTRWVPGFHMARISITEVSNDIQKFYEKDFAELIKNLGI